MDAVITINDPVIIPPEYFTVRYREAPGGVWTSLGAQTNDSFTIPGLDPGDYELEVRFVNEDGVLCPAVIREFEVTDEPDTCVCLSITGVSVMRMCEGIAIIHADFDTTGVGACQYKVEYTGFNGSNPQIITYPQGGLPPYIDLTIPYSTSSNAPSLKVSQICCDGTTLVCMDEVIATVTDQDCECIGPYITDAWLKYDQPTDTYTLCINFTSGGINTPPYTLTYDQQNVVPADSGIESEATFGYYEYELDPEPFTGELTYRVIVGNECGRDQRIVKLRQCGENIQYSGGENYPTEFTIPINPLVVANQIQFDAASVPDKLVVLINGLSVLDTGYIGNTAYQSVLDAELISRGDPTETITSASGMITYNYNNFGGGSYATIQVYGPLPNTSWNLVAICE